MEGVTKFVGWALAVLSVPALLAMSCSLPMAQRVISYLEERLASRMKTCTRLENHVSVSL